MSAAFASSARGSFAAAPATSPATSADSTAAQKSPVPTVGPVSTLHAENLAIVDEVTRPADRIWRAHTSSCVVMMNCT